MQAAPLRFPAVTSAARLAVHAGRPAGAVGLRLQHHPDRRGEGQGGLERGAEPVSAPRRPDPQSGRDGEGLCRAREGGAGRRRRGARQGDAGDGVAGNADRSRSLQGVPGKPVGADQRAVAAARGGRELSRPQGQPEFPGAAGAARRHREPHRGGPARLHRGGARVQHRRCKTFPSVLWATFWFTDNEPFQNFTVADDKIQTPKVDFGSGN